MRDARGRYHRPAPLDDLATAVAVVAEPRVLDPWGVPTHLTRDHPQRVDNPVDTVAARDARISRCGCGEWRYRPRNQHRDRPCPVCGRA